MRNLAEAPSRLFLGLIPWYGVLIVLGAALAIWMAGREAKRRGLPKDTIIDLALWLLPIGILGARIYYVIFSWDTFRNKPVSILYLWQGGLAIYGGLIAGFGVVIGFCRRRKLSLPGMLDILIPGVALAQGIGRWGNYFNQEAYGLALAADSPWAFFPLAVRIQAEGGAWHLATFFYESLLDGAIFLFLIQGRKKFFRKEGDTFLFYLLLYAAGRLVIEELRMDSLYLGQSIRVSQLLSALLCMGVIILFTCRRGKDEKKSFLWLALCAALLPAVLIILYCANIPAFANLSPGGAAKMLGACSLIMVLSGFLLYGRNACGKSGQEAEK